MKKIFLFFVVCLVASSCACSAPDYTPLDGKNIVKSEIHKEFSMSSWIADVTTFDAVNELSTQIVKCKIVEIDYLEPTVFSTISFKYNVEIEEIYLDVGKRLSVGDVVTVSSNNGIVKASEAEKLFKNSAAASKYGILQDGPYAENDYIVYSMFDGIPIEVGNTYVLYLTDDYLDTENVYADIGYSYSYVITDSGVYGGADIVKLNMNEEELRNLVKKGISKRTGRVQEVGRNQYISELAAEQKSNE